MVSRGQKLFQNAKGRFIPVLDRTHLYPSLDFAKIPGYEGQLYVGETLVDSARHYSAAHTGSLYSSRDTPLWLEEMDRLVDKYVPKGDTRHLMRFLRTSGVLNTVSSYLTIGFLSSLKIDTIVSLQEASNIEVDQIRMNEYRQAMESVGVELIHFPIQSHTTLLQSYPDDPNIFAKFDEEVVQKAVSSLSKTKNVYIHCKEGRSRSGQTAAAVLLKMFREGGHVMTAETVIKNITALREESFNTDEDAAFLKQYEDYLEGLNPMLCDSGAENSSSSSSWCVSDLTDMIRKPVLDAISEESTFLNLWRMDLPAKEAKAVAKLMESNSSFDHLNLFMNQIKDEGAKAIADMLKTNTSLRIIDMGDNHITDDGARAIADALKENQTLEKIYLHNNEISGDLQSELRTLCRQKQVVIEIW